MGAALKTTGQLEPVKLRARLLALHREQHRRAVAAGDRDKIARAARLIWRILGTESRNAWMHRQVRS